MSRYFSCFLLLLIGLQILPSVADETKKLPENLADWYKPSNKRQVWLHTMFGLRRELQAIEEYAQADNQQYLGKWIERFGKHYRSIGEMVPQWQEELDLESLARLEQDIASGKLGAVQSEIKRLKYSCDYCHSDYAALAALRFRSADFSKVKASNEQGQEISYADAMDELSKGVNRVKIASEDGRWPGAKVALTELQGNLDRLGKTCVNCHKDNYPVNRILGDEVKAVFAKLDESIARQDVQQAGHELGQASVMVCARCHSIHRTLNDLKSYLFK